jgi:hypothetical protein
VKVSRPGTPPRSAARSTGSTSTASDLVGFWFVLPRRQTIYQRRGHGFVLVRVAGRLEPPRAPASSPLPGGGATWIWESAWRPGGGRSTGGSDDGSARNADEDRDSTQLTGAARAA